MRADARRTISRRRFVALAGAPALGGVATALLWPAGSAQAQAQPQPHPGGAPGVGQGPGFHDPRSAFAPPALQPVTRDFAFLVPENVTAETLLRAIRGSDKGAITDARLFDRFETGDGLSLAFEVTLQPVDKSMTDAGIGDISTRIVAAAEKLGARLRS